VTAALAGAVAEFAEPARYGIYKIIKGAVTLGRNG
jgi:hypothetical protein